MENDTKPSPLRGMENRVAVVTGGGRGIGRAISRELARQGAAVVVNYAAHAQAAESAVIEIERDGGQAMAIQADVSDRTAVEAMVHAAVQRFGGIDILVNNAGIDVAVSVLDTTDADWERIFAVNARGCFLCTQIAARVMINAGGGGRIINISSLNARLGWIARAAYSASKGAMEAFTRCCARDLGQGLQSTPWHPVRFGPTFGAMRSRPALKRHRPSALPSGTSESRRMSPESLYFWRPHLRALSPARLSWWMAAEGHAITCRQSMR